VKLVFIVVELALAIVFIVSNFRDNFNIAAIIEWIVAVIFSFYVFSFAIDLWPAVATRHGHGSSSRYNLKRGLTTSEMEEAVRTGDYDNAAGLPRGTHDSERTLTDGHPPTVVPAAATAVPPSHKPYRAHADNF
jgi:hypothetical protein